MGWFNGSDGEPKRKKCMVCGERKSQAFWHGHKDIQVCGSCAEQVLVALLVDANFPGARREPQRLLYAMERRFWKALWWAGERARREKRT